MNLKFGCDPELWVVDTKTNKIVPAFGMIPGTKENPHKVERGAVQVDGLAVEFNIDPVETREEWLTNINTVMRTLRQMVQDVNPDYELLATPVAEFDLREFKKYPMEARILGCDPDFNSSGKANRNPSRTIFSKPKRTTSGHIHVGFTEGVDPRHPRHFELCRRMAQIVSERHAVPVTEAEVERLKYYGMDGSFRPKSYGVEIRSFSNLWLKDEESILKMFDDVQDTVIEILSESPEYSQAA